MNAVLITGTSTGIGRATALHLDRLGYKVFASVRKEEDAKSLQEEASSNLLPVMMDMNKADSIDKAFERISASVGSNGLAGVVNNAGAHMGGPLEYFDLDQIRRGFEVNLLGPIHIIQKFLPLIRKQKGRIINIGSIGGIFPAPFNAPYGASKAAIQNLTNALRRELLPEGIHVSLIVPGNIKTAIWEKVQKNTKSTSPETEAQYGQALRAMEKITNKMGSQGIPPESVAKVIEDALTRKRPKTCYIVGMDAKIQSIVSAIVPNRIQDTLFMLALGIKCSNP